MRRCKPVRKLLFCIYPVDEWILRELSGKKRKGRSGEDAETIRRALKINAAILELRPPAELLELERGKS